MQISHTIASHNSVLSAYGRLWQDLWIHAKIKSYFDSVELAYHYTSDAWSIPESALFLLESESEPKSDQYPESCKFW